MPVEDRYQFAREQQERYWAASRAERSRILDAFCMATGYGRKYAITMLRGRKRVSVRSARRRARRYGLDFQKGLRVAWEASGYICSKRLQPFLGELVALLGEHGQLTLDDPTRALLVRASVSTVERNLRVLRHGLVSRKMSQTKPGTLLRKQIPAIVGQWADRDVPGYLEIDLVSHSGSSPPPHTESFRPATHQGLLASGFGAAGVHSTIMSPRSARVLFPHRRLA